MLNEYIGVSSGFESSVNIALDLNNPKKVENFIPTTSALEVLESVFFSVDNTSTYCAKTFTGAYGKGKSHIVLVLLSLLMNPKDKSMFSGLLKYVESYNENLHKSITNYLSSGKRLLPVVINGNSGNLTTSFIEGLTQSLRLFGLEDVTPSTSFSCALDTIKLWEEEYPNTFKKFQNSILSTVKAFRKRLRNYDTQAYREFTEVYPRLTSGSVFNPWGSSNVVELYKSTNEKLKEYGYSGMYIVYDEFGKYLETSISTATESDTKLLQDLAEHCNKHPKQQLHLMLICHKDISNYIDMNLPQDRVNGWRGIEGRFESISLSSDYSQTYELIANVIVKKPSWGSFVSSNAKQFESLRLKYSKMFPSSECVESCYPLHPTTTYILPILSEKIAQNERTLFTFLSAKQKHTLFDFLNTTQQSEETFPLMTPDYLYDYFEPLMKKELNSSSIHTIYRLTSSILSKVDGNVLYAKLVKTIALLYMIDHFKALPPTRDTLCNIFADTGYTAQTVDDSIQYLIDNLYIVYLKKSNGYLKLKESSGVDIQLEISKSVERVKDKYSIIDILNMFVLENYIYPTSYNDTHCIVRYFDLVFTSAENYRSVDTSKYSSGKVLALVLSTDDDIQAIRNEILAYRDDQTIFILPNFTESVSSVVYEYCSVVELKSQSLDDTNLCAEYDIYLEDYYYIIDSFIREYLNPMENRCEYYYNGEVCNIHRKSQLSDYLSNICEILYPNTPIINNENLNKNELSTVAINSRNKLVKAILSNEPANSFGLSGTGQDISFLRSTLVQTGILVGDSLTLTPTDKAMCNVLQTIKEYFTSMDTVNKSFGELYYRLTSKEYGIGLKKGVIPIYIAVVIRKIDQDVTVMYKDSEVKLSADILNDINENPQDYSILTEDWNETKLEYLQGLEDIFRDYLLKDELHANRFMAIFQAMNRWVVSLPKCSRGMKQYYTTGKNIPIKDTKFLNAIKQPTQNYREVLMVKLPKAFGFASVDTSIIERVRGAKNTFDLGKSQLLDTVRDTITETFKANSESSVVSTMLDWYETLKPTTLEYMFPNHQNHILNLISTAQTDDVALMESLGKSLTGLRLNDWNYSTVGKFKESLIEFKTSVDTYNLQEKSNSMKDTSCKLVLNRNGENVTKVFEKTEYSNLAKLLYNDISSAIDEMGQAITEHEKRQVLIDVLLELCE